MQKLRYRGTNSINHIKYLTLDKDLAVKKGLTFIEKNYEYTICDSDKLELLVHMYCPHLNVKLQTKHNYTIAEFYNLCPSALYDLINYYGEEQFLADIINGYDELYKQLSNNSIKND